MKHNHIFFCRLSLVLLCSAVCAALFPAAAVGTARDIDETSSPSSQDPGFFGTYRIGPGDILSVRVFHAEELSQDITVSESGTINLPYAGQLRVQGMTATEIEAALRERLGASLLKDPQVLVSVHEHMSQPVVILGEVKTPGTYFIKNRITVIDALSLAGGLREDAADTLVLKRLRPSASGPMSEEVTELSISRLLSGQDSSLDVSLEAHDIIHVPRREKRQFYVLGDVGRPGAFELEPEQESVLLTQAIATAGGFLRTARAKEVRIIRQDENGKSSQIRVDLARVLKDQALDRQIHHNDVVFVPNSKSKNLSVSLLNGFAGIVSGGLLSIGR